MIIKRPFPPTASAHPMPLCSRWCPRLVSARTLRAAHPGEHPTRVCPRRPAPPGATPRRHVEGERVCPRLWGAHNKTWRAARVMALESGAAPRAPRWHPAPRAAAACSSRWWRRLPVTQPQAGPVSPPACGRPPGAGWGRRPEARGTAGGEEALAGMPQEKGLYISYTLSARYGRTLPIACGGVKSAPAWTTPLLSISNGLGK